MPSDIKLEKAEDLALEIVKLHRYLTDNKREFTLSNQILRSGTSIGANIAEAQYSESNADFVHKLGISRKEANETLYWLRLLCKGDYIDKEMFLHLYSKTEEMLRILTSIILSLKKSPK